MPDAPATDLPVQDLPDTVDQEFAAASFDGQAVRPEEGDGRTLYDGPRSEDGTVTVVFAQAHFDRWRAQALAHIHSSDKKRYLAQVVRGPFAAPIGLPADAPPLVVTQVENALFTPPYYGW